MDENLISDNTTVESCLQKFGFTADTIQIWSKFELYRRDDFETLIVFLDFWYYMTMCQLTNECKLFESALAKSPTNEVVRLGGSDGFFFLRRQKNINKDQCLLVTLQRFLDVNFPDHELWFHGTRKIFAYWILFGKIDEFKREFAPGINLSHAQRDHDFSRVNGGFYVGDDWYLARTMAHRVANQNHDEPYQGQCAVIAYIVPREDVDACHHVQYEHPWREVIEFYRGGGLRPRHPSAIFLDCLEQHRNLKGYLCMNPGGGDIPGPIRFDQPLGEKVGPFQIGIRSDASAFRFDGYEKILITWGSSPETKCVRQSNRPIASKINSHELYPDQPPIKVIYLPRETSSTFSSSTFVASSSASSSSSSSSHGCSTSKSKKKKK